MVTQVILGTAVLRSPAPLDPGITSEAEYLPRALWCPHALMGNLHVPSHEAMRGREHPPGAEDGARTQVYSILQDANLPGELISGCQLAAHHRFGPAWPCLRTHGCPHTTGF